MSNHAAPVLDGGKWTDLAPNPAKAIVPGQSLRNVFSHSEDYGAPELGIVTGNNDFFHPQRDARASVRA